MKPLLDKFIKVFSQYRDWLWVGLFVGAIVFFMQQIQAEQGKSPEKIWQGEYGKLIRPAVNPLGAQTTSSKATDASKNIADLFIPIKEDQIGAISYNPIFMPADEYGDLVGRLKQLHDDFQAAQDRGDIKTAIDKLRQYVAEDPKGLRLSGSWTTEPGQLLRNLVCNELVQTVESALSEGQQAGKDVKNLAQTDPMKALETIRKTKSDLDSCLKDVDANSDCLEDSRISDARLLELKQLRDRIAEQGKSLNQKLIRQQYDQVVQQANAVGPKTTPEKVAKTIQAIQDFRALIERQGADVLTQTQLDRLVEIRKKVEANKDSLMNQVQQKIDRIASDPQTNKNLERIQEILRQFDILRLLGEGETKIAQRRRKWESLARRLEAADAVKRIRSLLKDVASGLDEVDSLLDKGEDSTEVLKRINGYFTQIEVIRKNTKGIRTVKEYNTEVRNQLRKLKVKFQQRKKAALAKSSK